jgi:hypothetical protein
VARLPWLWGSVLVVTLALVAFTLAVATLTLITRMLTGRHQRRHVRPSWELLESSGNGQTPEDHARWPRQRDPER